MKVNMQKMMGKMKRVKKKYIPRIELGLLDSKSNVLTITPYVLACYLSRESLQLCYSE